MCQQHLSSSRLFSILNTLVNLGGFTRTCQIRLMGFPFGGKVIGSRVFHKAFYDVLVGWQEGRTIGQRRVKTCMPVIVGGVQMNIFFNEYFLFVTYATTF